jgi:hypothetical protein
LLLFSAFNRFISITTGKRSQTIIIDEGQEITPNWYKKLGSAVKTNDLGITIFYDLNQLGGSYQLGTPDGMNTDCRIGIMVYILYQNAIIWIFTSTTEIQEKLLNITLKFLKSHYHSLLNPKYLFFHVGMSITIRFRTLINYQYL